MDELKNEKIFDQKFLSAMATFCHLGTTIDVPRVMLGLPLQNWPTVKYIIGVTHRTIVPKKFPKIAELSLFCCLVPSIVPSIVTSIVPSTLN